MKIRELLKNRRVVGGCAAAALAVIIGSVALMQRSADVPELPTYTDPVIETNISDEETPLAAKPKTTTKTSKKTKKKTVKLKTASKKTYSKKLPTKTKTTTKTTENANAKITTKTTVKTATVEKYTKKSKKKVVTTTTTTTVRTTTVAKAPEAVKAYSLESGETAKASTSTQAQKAEKYTADINTLAPMMDSRVVSAYKKLGFTIEVDSSVNYAGLFDAREASITLKYADDTIYHELGHFLSFIAGNIDTKSDCVNAYNKEKSKLSGASKTYASQNSSEYFAESVKDYTQNPAALKNSRPLTYEVIQTALDKATDAQISKILSVYGPLWN